MNKSLLDFHASIAILRVNIDLFHNGRYVVYRTVAVELRKLLCDKKNSLLSRIFVEVKLQQLNSAAMFQKHPELLVGLVHFAPGRLTFSSSGEPRYELNFAKDKTLLSLEEWVEQPFFNKEITIRELIKSVADKESAHSDLEYNPTLLNGNSFQYGNIESHVLSIIAIGKYVVEFLDREYENLELKTEYKE